MISWTVNNGTLVSNTAQTTVTVTSDERHAGEPGDSMTVTEDVASPLTGIVFADPDAAGNAVLATLSVASGSLAAAPRAAASPSAAAASTMTLAGTLTDLNTFIANGNLAFTTALNDTANVNLTVTLNDNGHTGMDPGLTGNGTSEEDTDIVTLTVTAVNDAPVNDTSNILDIVTANGGSSNNVSVLIGAGDGTFATGSPFAAGNDPASVALGDINNDGHLDIVAANANDNTVGVLIGDGLGGFARRPRTRSAPCRKTSHWATSMAMATSTSSPPTSSPATSACCWATVLEVSSPPSVRQSLSAPRRCPSPSATCDGDDDLDIVTANNVSSNVSVLLGDGNGTLRPCHRLANRCRQPAVVRRARRYRRRRPSRHRHRQCQRATASACCSATAWAASARRPRTAVGDCMPNDASRSATSMAMATSTSSPPIDQRRRQRAAGRRHRRFRRLPAVRQSLSASAPVRRAQRPERRRQSRHRHRQ